MTKPTLLDMKIMDETATKEKPENIIYSLICLITYVSPLFLTF